MRIKTPIAAIAPTQIPIVINVKEKTNQTKYAVLYIKYEKRKNNNNNNNK